jgi:hypothetical protein
MMKEDGARGLALALALGLSLSAMDVTVDD